MRDKSDGAYRRVLLPFVLWLMSVNVAPIGGPQLDDMLTEYQAGSDNAPPVSRGSFEKLIAAVEKVIPHVKGELALPRSIVAKLEGMLRSTTRDTNDTGPLSLGGVGAYHLRDGACCGPCGSPSSSRTAPGRGCRTKRGRPRPGRRTASRNGSRGRPSSGHSRRHEKRPSPGGAVPHHPCQPHLERFSLITTKDGLLTHIRTLGGYALCICMGTKAANLKAAWKPHSPRAGFYTQACLEGATPDQIAAVTRHTSLKSLRSYIDATSVLAGQLALQLADTRPRINYLIENFGRIWVGEMIRTGRAPAEAAALVPKHFGPLEF